MNERIPMILSRIELRDGVPCWRRTQKPVRGFVDGDGYRRFILTVGKRRYNFSLHRVVWLLHNGAWPTQQIDHINRDKSDNRIENLRDVSAAINGMNKARRGIIPGRGISRDSRGRPRPWRAEITHDGQLMRLGWFATRDEALATRLAAEQAIVAGTTLFPAQTAGNALTPAVALSPPRVGSPRGCEHGLGLSRSPLATAPMPKEQSEDRGRQPRNVVQQVEALHPLE